MEGAQAVDEDLSLAGNLGLLGVESSLRSEREAPATGRTITVSVRNETEMTSAKAIILSDVAWIHNMW